MSQTKTHTNIRITLETWEYLNHLKKHGESFDDVITKMKERLENDP